MLTPLDIQNHEFKKGFRGYSEDEVDEFLDRIVSDYEKLMRENEKLKERAGANDKELTHYKGIEQNLQNTLIVAQKTAEDVLNSARKNAKEIRDNASNEAQNIHENTIREAQNIRVQAQLDAKKYIDDTLYKLNFAIMEYDKLVREKSTFLWKMRAALESELAVVTQLLNSMPTAGEVETLKANALKVVQSVKNSETAAKVNQDDSPTVKISKTEKTDDKKDTAEQDTDEDSTATTTYKPVKKN